MFISGRWNMDISNFDKSWLPELKSVYKTREGSGLYVKHQAKTYNGKGDDLLKRAPPRFYTWPQVKESIDQLERS